LLHGFLSSCLPHRSAAGIFSLELRVLLVLVVVLILIVILVVILILVLIVVLVLILILVLVLHTVILLFSHIFPFLGAMTVCTALRRFIQLARPNRRP
jgi:hypothetical protein